MARFTIYSKDGRDIRYVGEPQYSGSYMGVDFVEFRSVSCPIPIPWEIGDYVDYFRTGKRYKLYSLPMPNKVARANAYGGAFEYANVQLHGATKELEIAPFRDLVPYDNTIHFSTRPEVSTYENVYGIARRIQECINDIFPHRWRIEVYDTDDADLLALFNETKEYSVSNGSCLDALAKIYETWKNVGWVHTYDSANDVDVITIGKSNVRTSDNTSDLFTYGKGNLLTSIKKASANEGEFATRIYVYGSERNIQTRYYNGFDILNKDSVDIRNLMIPLEAWGTTDGVPDARKAYLQAEDAVVEKYGIIPRTVYFDGTEHEEIYPSIVGLTMSRVRQAMIDLGQGDSEYLPDDKSHRIDTIDESFSAPYDEGTKEQTEKNMTFRLGLYQMGFNVAEQGKLTTEGYATISMKTGMCAGREFKVRKYADISYEKSDGTKCLVYEIERNWDESIGMGFPNRFYPIKDGDEFVLLDIPMPDFYIALAEDDLLEAGRKLLKDYTKDSVFYEPSINAIKIKDGGRPLYAGMFMQIKDEDIIDTEDNVDYILIDTLTIDEKSELPQYKVTLRDQKRSSRSYSALEDMIEDVKEGAKEEIVRERRYADRRFRDVQETVNLLQGAIEGFTDGISPITVQTMALMVGDQSLQFKFTESRDSLVDVPCPVVYDNEYKHVHCLPAALVHMTLDVDDIKPTDNRVASDYRSWDVLESFSETLEDGDARYVYIKASRDNAEDATLALSKTPIAMMSDADYYHFLVGILNSEYDNTRSFVTLYGFTEVLPGQITTDVIRSGNNNLVIDLVNALIVAKNGATIEGSLKITEGSLMSSRIDVGDTSSNDVEAFLNGSDFARDDSSDDCGKLILAAGIPQGEGELEERAKAATTRIYEDGCTYTKNLHLQEGCTLGQFKVDNDGISVNGCEQGLDVSTYVHSGSVKVDGVENNGSACEIKRSLKIDASESSPAFLMIDQDSGDAIRVVRGEFAGLRPRTAYISSIPYDNAKQGRVLRDEDHTILFPYDSGSGDWVVYLPSNPQNGQEYWLEMMGANVKVYVQNKKWWSHQNGTLNDGSAPISFDFRGSVRLKFFGGLIPNPNGGFETEGIWTLSIIETYK